MSLNEGYILYSASGSLITMFRVPDTSNVMLQSITRITYRCWQLDGELEEQPASSEAGRRVMNANHT